MRPWLLLLFCLCLPLPVAASHQWAGIDLCEVYRDSLPPGLTIESLPEPKSNGAALLQQYCTQCHNLPGPDRHTAAEWRDVASKMFMLMDVSKRFGGVTGRVEVMDKQQQEALTAYLDRFGSKQTLQKSADQAADQIQWLTPLLVMSPFLLLMGLGLVRWWGSNRENKPCVTR